MLLNYNLQFPYFSDTVNEAMEEITAWLINKGNRCELQLKTRRSNISLPSFTKATTV